MSMTMAPLPVDLAGVGEPGWDMSTQTAKPKRETWRDWQPPGAPEPEQLLTKEQLLAELRKMGEHISARTLNHWQAIGLIPRPVRRWYEGKPASLYPAWMPELVALARGRRSDGDNPDEIARSLMEWVAEQKTPTRYIEGSDTIQVGAHVDIHLGTHASAHVRRDDSPAATAYEDALATAQDAVNALATARERWAGVPVHRARLQLFDEHGQRDDHWWHIPPAPDAE